MSAGLSGTGTEAELAASGDASPVDPPQAGASESEQVPAAGTETATETPAAESESGFDDPYGYGPGAIAAQLKDDPAAAAALEANPGLKATVFANARKAERAAKYDEILGSPEDAQYVVQSHEAFSNLTNLMAGVEEGKPQTVSAVIDAMLMQTALRDDKGEILRNNDGSPKTDGTIGRFLKNWFQGRMDYLAQQAQSKNDDDALAAIDILMERSGLRTPSSPSSEEGMSEELRAQKADIERREAALREQQTASQQADLQASDDRVDSQVDAHLATTMQGIMAKATGLTTDYAKQNAQREIGRELKKLILGSASYHRELREAKGRPMGPGREAAIVKVRNSYINRLLPKVAKEVFAKAGAEIDSQQQQRSSTQAAREAAARSEGRGSLAPNRQQSQPGAAAETPEQVMQDLRTKLNREPTTEEFLKERMTRRMKPAA